MFQIRILKQFPEPAQAQMDKQKETANVRTLIYRDEEILRKQLLNAIECN